MLTAVPDGMLQGVARLLSGGGSALVRSLPHDAGAALAVPAAGESAATLLSSFAGALYGAARLAELRRDIGVDLEPRLVSWAGDTGRFVAVTGRPRSTAR